MNVVNLQWLNPFYAAGLRANLTVTQTIERRKGLVGEWETIQATIVTDKDNENSFSCPDFEVEEEDFGLTFYYRILTKNGFTSNYSETFSVLVPKPAVPVTDLEAVYIA